MANEGASKSYNLWPASRGTIGSLTIQLLAVQRPKRKNESLLSLGTCPLSSLAWRPRFRKINYQLSSIAKSQSEHPQIRHERACLEGKSQEYASCARPMNHVSCSAAVRSLGPARQPLDELWMSIMRQREINTSRGLPFSRTNVVPSQSSLVLHSLLNRDE